jgi:formylglycine-generating enzyme required for sulfatase activity
MIGFIISCLFLQGIPPESPPELSVHDALGVAMLLDRLSTDTWEARERAFYHLQLFGQKAVPFLKAARSGLDLQVRSKVDYLVKHVPILQERVLVPAGTIRLGTADPYCRNPEHQVVLESFEIDRYEVTHFMFYRFVRETGHSPPPFWRGGRYRPGAENLPVNWVSFEDAQAYARWLGRRLPTVDEWEYAARGEEGRLFPWGDEARLGVANIHTGRLTEVGSYPSDQSPVGCMDMAGNVSEWVMDPAVQAPTASALKGSAFNRQWRTPFIYSCYQAFYKAPDYLNEDVGFRCAR